MIDFKASIRKIGFFCLITAAAFLLTGCKCNCTEEFFIQTITVLDENGSVVENATVTAFNPQTGTALNLNSDDYNLPEGVFVVLTDNYVKDMEENDLYLGVAIEKEGYETEILQMVFGTDFCACHIELLEGETLIQLTPSN